MAAIQARLARLGNVALSGIAGKAGVGKTALAVHVGHQAAGDFPDGQLFVNLGGFGGRRIPASEALAVAEPDKTKVRFQYRLPGQSAWTDLPVADVTLNGTALSAWPVNTDLSNPALSRAPAGLVWNVATTRGGVDGPVEIRARFSNATASEVTNVVTVTLETRAAGGSYASVPVGPFSVTLVNGALSLMATDGSEKAFGSSLAVARSYNSLQASTDGLFGMGWQSTLYTAGVPWSRLDDAGTSVTLVGEEDASLFFKPDIGPSGLGLPASSSSVEIARALDTVNLYADGVDLVDSYGPLHLIAIDGGWVYARAHTHSTYGQLDQPGADPTAGGPRHALVEQTVAASRGVSASPVDETDLRTTRYRYALSASDTTGWTFRAPMATVTLMFGWQPDIVRETRFDPVTGEVVETRQPSAAGNGASPGTTRTTYYAAGPHNPAACVSSAWYGLACKVEPGAQPGVAGLPGLPVRHIDYDTFLRPVVTSETVVDAGGTTRSRTSTTTYENAGVGPRVVSNAVTGGVGTAVPTTTVGYDAANGLITTLSTPAGTTRMAYNEFGRVRTYTDADGATTTTSYGANGGRVLSIAWKDASGVALGSQSIHYDGGGEHRGLATSVTDGGIAGGSITATYDADGALVSQGMPNGITAAATIDPTGAVTRMAYSRAGAAWFEDREDLNIHGQARWHVGPMGWEAFGYDGAGRLGAVWDQRNGQPCMQRSYGMDGNSNRTALSAWAADASGGCPPSTTPTTTSYSYDAADRQQPTGAAAGLAYDAFGRVTNVPASLAGGTAATIAYTSTGMVASESQGGVTMSWTLDPAQRLRTYTRTGQATRTNHYSDTGDSPAWIDEGDGTRTRYVGGFNGSLVAAITYTGATAGAVQYQLVGLHGDVITTATPAASTPDGAYLGYDEYGVPRGATQTARYGWLGGKQRSSDGFYSRMMSLCRQQHRWWDPRRYICYRVAATYYWGVRKFGWFPFYFGKRC